MIPHPPSLAIANEFLAAGLSVVPLRLDGSKSPAIPAWKEYQQRTPSPDELSRWFARPAGIGLVCGRISGGLEVIDFDQAETFEPWRSLVTGIVEYLPIVETASGGFHCLYRCQEIAGNSKLASWEPADCLSHRESGTRRGCGGQPVKATRIETRGEGGYIVAVGSPAEVHASGNPYVQIAGPVIPEVPVVTPADRRRLWEAAATFDCSGRKSAKVAGIVSDIKRQRFEQQRVNRPPGDVPPWEDFDRRGDWSEILEPHGWRSSGDGKWTRPGKMFGISASVCVGGEGVQLLTVFTTSVAELPPGSYGKFRAFAALNHGGDGKAAAKALAGLGYGSHGSRRAA